jgi:hypothetical protein
MKKNESGVGFMPWREFFASCEAYSGFNIGKHISCDYPCDAMVEVSPPSMLTTVLSYLFQ